ncbi:electron transfer flavoprotein subunit beta/FixA family protein [Candidatus Hodgkinia cicadicola]|uniref:Electron transfer flavoprotein small subunit n=1 Tax=Candidatus Hodgkinia cicadicola TaxID=573658 RepID=A0ABX4MH59_9HYPH|nr:Electron transfer flavoprotein small subunit [Candidatus Hodgkinia cicadicola]
MKILITVKIIYDPKIELRQQNGMLCFENISRVINPIDEESVMAAVDFKNKNPGVKLSAVCIGDDVDEKIYKYVLAMGVDEAFLIRSVKHRVKDLDDLTIAKVLKKFIKINKYDLVLTGKSTFGNNTGWVGPALAALLGWHQLYYAYNLLKFTTNELTVQCHAYNRTITFVVKLPCVLVCNFTNFIKYIGLTGIILMLNTPIKTVFLPDLHIKPNSCVETMELLAIDKPRKCKFFDDVNSLMDIIFG